MPVSEEELSRRCEEIFGEPIDARRRTTLAAVLDSADRTNLDIVNALAPEAEPMGHLAILKGTHHGG